MVQSNNRASRSRRNYVGVIDFHEDDDEVAARLCENCLKYGYEVKLGAKCLFKGEQPQPDHDQFMQCYQCGNIYPRWQTKSEQTIEGSLFLATTHLIIVKRL